MYHYKAVFWVTSGSRVNATNHSQHNGMFSNQIIRSLDNTYGGCTYIGDMFHGHTMRKWLPSCFFKCRDPSESQVLELKLWLMWRGAPQSNKKANLVRRFVKIISYHVYIKKDLKPLCHGVLKHILTLILTHLAV